MRIMFDKKKEAIDAKRIAKGSTATPDETTRNRRIDEKIDRDLRDSFPASDPPGWTLGV